jgi:hypothetical protein
VGGWEGGMGGWRNGWMDPFLIWTHFSYPNLRNGYKGGVKVLSSRGWAKGKSRGEYRFSSLMKKKEKNYALFYFAEKRFYLYL